MGCTTLDLREKDVINVCDGQKLGKVAELEIDTECGRVTALIVIPSGVCASLFTKNHIRVPWDKIEKMGKDTILVNMPLQSLQIKGQCEGTQSCKNEKKWWKF